MRIKLTADVNSAVLRHMGADQIEAVTDILEHLKFTDDIQGANERHPILQVFFDNLAAEVSAEAARFEEIQMIRWLAKHRAYVRNYLASQGQRDTGDLVRDTLVLCFGNDRAADEPFKQTVTRQVYRGQLLQTMSAPAADARIKDLRTDESYGTVMDELHTSVWADVNAGFTFDSMMDISISLRAEVAKAKALSLAFQSRGFRISDFIRMLNVGPTSNLDPASYKGK